MPASTSRTSVADFRWRHRYARWLLLVLFPLFALAAPPADRPGWLIEIFEGLGITFLVLCLIGRGWTSVYIAGRKSHELVTIGPYSVVRNPLYVFSFFGLVGVGLLSEMMTVLFLSIGVFALYYWFFIRREERRLTGIHGKKYIDYMQAVPRWFPKFSNWRDAETLEIRPRVLLRQFRDTSLFFLAFLFFELCEYFREIGYLIPLIYVP